MNLCLTHPKHGYYSKANVFGTKGDFITAPEVSLIFGEMVGVFISNAVAKEKTFDIVELGPGRGTLASDVTRTVKKLSVFTSKLSKYYLIESSQKLVEKQADLLAGYPIVHLPDIASLKEDAVPKVVIANEFFDALPVNLIEYAQNSNGQFTFKELEMINFPPTHLKASESETEASLWCRKNANLIFPNLHQESGTFEISLESIKQCSLISSLILKSPQNSFGLIIDYGNDKSAIVQD